MKTARLVDSSEVRGRFARAMSDMYQAEVPQYGTLLDLVAEVNTEIVTNSPEFAEQLAAAGELDRLDIERHGAIRVGTADELCMLRRLFAAMGMHPVGYYDLSVAGVPVHSTAFRPVEKAALDRNPFRLFTSLLRLDLIADDTLRARATEILADREIFTPGVRELIETYESQGGLDDEQAERFVEEALETFRWHQQATVDLATYEALRAEHPLVADVVCFRGPHINHLTPRTLDIDAVQQRMPAKGIEPKALIEGPPRRAVPILLRQTSFKALEESIRFAGDSDGHHTARFGEVEQRGVALTYAGRVLYDHLLARAAGYKNDADNRAYQAALSGIFKEFPEDEDTLRRQGLAYFHYRATDVGAPGHVARDDLEALIAAGCIRARPIIYEDFLPVSAAGIFRSNLGSDNHEQTHGDARSEELAEALGVPIIDELTLYDDIQERSKRNALEAIRRLQATG